MNLNIIMDRAFDAICAKRAGMNELHDQIMARLNGNYPTLNGYIRQLYELYDGFLDEATEPRSQYLKEHKDKLRLRYR